MPDFRDVIPGTRASAGRVSLAELQAAMASGELTSAALRPPFSTCTASTG